MRQRGRELIYPGGEKGGKPEEMLEKGTLKPSKRPDLQSLAGRIRREGALIRSQPRGGEEGIAADEEKFVTT